MKNYRKLLLPAILGKLLITGLMFLSFTNVNAAEELRGISVAGTGEIEVEPDRALINLSVYQSAKNVREAKDRHDKKTAELYKISEKLGIAKDKIKTQNYSVNPKYQWNQQTQKNVQDGYETNQQIEFTIDDLKKVDVLLEEFANAGFDRVNSVNYTLADPNKYEQQAIVKALNHAKAKANLIASTYNVTIEKVLRVEESGGSYPPMIPFARMGMAKTMMADSAGAAPEVTSPGLIKIQRNVSAVFAIK